MARKGNYTAQRKFHEHHEYEDIPGTEYKTLEFCEGVITGIRTFYPAPAMRIIRHLDGELHKVEDEYEAQGRY